MAATLDGGVGNFSCELGVDVESFKWGMFLINDKHMGERGEGEDQIFSIRRPRQPVSFFYMDIDIERHDSTVVSLLLIYIHFLRLHSIIRTIHARSRSTLSAHLSGLKQLVAQ